MKIYFSKHPTRTLFIEFSNNFLFYLDMKKFNIIYIYFLFFR